ncbi:MAG: hypothetical protein ABFD50_20915 [Smithella sp.]
MNTMTTFVNENKIKMDVEYADENKLNPGWKDANHYKVILKCNGKQLTTYFSQGYGITGEPKPEDVLNALASDSSGVENARSFEDWASEYGYDTDSRKAEKIYKVCEKQAKKLNSFLGYEKYQELLYNTESL